MALTRKEVSDRYYAKNRDVILARNCEYQRTHPRTEYVKAYRVKRRLIAKDKQLRKDFGIGLETYCEMLRDQNGVCKICFQPPSHGRIYLSVDHDHKTGAIRGLLCNECNFAIAHLKDSLFNLESAFLYLRGTQV